MPDHRARELREAVGEVVRRRRDCDGFTHGGPVGQVDDAGRAGLVPRAGRAGGLGDAGQEGRIAQDGLELVVEHTRDEPGVERLPLGGDRRHDGGGDLCHSGLPSGFGRSCQGPRSARNSRARRSRASCGGVRLYRTSRCVRTTPFLRWRSQQRLLACSSRPNPGGPDVRHERGTPQRRLRGHPHDGNLSPGRNSCTSSPPRGASRLALVIEARGVG